MSSTTIRQIEIPVELESRIEEIARKTEQSFEDTLTDLLRKQLNTPHITKPSENYADVLNRTFGSWLDISEDWFDEVRDSWDERQEV